MLDFMGGFFIVFGGLKAISWSGFVQTFQTYDILAKRNKIYAYAYPALELLLGVLYLTRNYLVFANIATLIIMVVGSIGVAKALRKTDRIECACLGKIFSIPLSKATLVEDVGMAVMAAVMLALG